MRQHDLNTQLQEAITLAQAGQRAEARAMLLAIVQADPDQALAWLWLATVSTARAERIEYLERALALNPGSATAQQAYRQLTGQEYVPPAPAAAPARADWMRTLTGEAPISTGNFVIILAVAAVAVVAIMVAVRTRDDNSDQPRPTPRLIVPGDTPTPTSLYSPVPSLTPLPTVTPGPSPTSVWDAPPPTWTPVPSRTQPPSSTPRPTFTPIPTRTDTPSPAPPTGSPTPTGTEPPNAATLAAEFALTSDAPRSTPTLSADLKTATVKFEQTMRAATEPPPTLTATPTLPATN